MKRIEPNGSEWVVECADKGDGGRGNGIVIPGAWMIKKSLFESLGGYDARLAYAENTEFFIRLDQVQVKREYIPNANFLYHPSPIGGSKNLQNMVDSLTIILEKHKDTLSNHVKYLYHQIIGVNSIRFRRFSDARFHLWKAISYKPFSMATWGRFGLACFPFLAKRLYSETVNYA